MGIVQRLTPRGLSRVHSAASGRTWQAVLQACNGISFVCQSRK